MQKELWHDNLDDATKAAVDAAGGIKAVSGKLWPATDPDSAATKLRACLNPDHAQKFSLGEWLMIGKLSREAGDNSIMMFLGRELANEVKPITLGAAKKQARKQRISTLLAEAARLAQEEE